MLSLATDLVVLGLLSISLERDLVSMVGKMIAGFEFLVLENESEILFLSSHQRNTPYDIKYLLVHLSFFFSFFLKQKKHYLIKNEPI